MKKILLTFAFVGASIASFAQLGSLTVGQAAPNFTVTDLHGHSHTLSDYAGKYVLIDFFTYWCGPCATTAPIINEFYKKYGCNGYNIVVLAIEGDGTTEQTTTFENANGGDPNYPTPTIAGLTGGGSAVHTTYAPQAYPTIILVGPDGLIKNTDIWPVSAVSSLETAITNAGGSSALVVHNCSLSLDEVSVLESATIYPNPSNSNTSISLNSLENGSLNAEVIDINGKVISSVSQSITEGENLIPLNAEGIENGTYIVKITFNGTEKRIPFVKM